ncbi:MAG: RidA family protein [Pseudomonadota bacterium]|nr:RidA family protein [Pseudomonadota bacterium]
MIKLRSLCIVTLAVALSACMSVREVSHAPAAAPSKQAYQPGKLFSPVVKSGKLLFLSGVIGRVDAGPNGIEHETRRVLDTIGERLALAGGRMEDIVKCTVFLDDIANYEAMNAIYASYFPHNPPARTALAVKALPLGALVEIECIAVER